MTRIIALLLLAAGPAWTQEATVDAAGTPVAAEASAASSAEPSAEAGATEEVPFDPMAAWEADPSAILDAAEVDLDAFEYIARPLVVFGDSPRQPQVAEQLRLIEADMGNLVARDVAVILDTDRDDRSAVRQQLRPRGFEIVLLDKDGRVTIRRPAPLSVREITRAIDRTPIRQEELRRGRGSEPAE